MELENVKANPTYFTKIILISQNSNKKKEIYEIAVFNKKTRG
jgi:hypothetical protein